MSKSENVVNSVRKRKKDLISLFGSRCCLCGFNDFQEALDFHHVNPELKEFSLSGSQSRALEKQLEEAKKCILVCSNCHRGIHAGKLQVPKNWEQLYQTDIADQLIEQKNLVKNTFCEKCGKKISNTAQLCEKCYHESTRKVEFPQREQLKYLIRNTPFTKIGIQFGVSDNAIRKWCKSMNLPYKAKEIKQYTNEEWNNI